MIPILIRDLAIAEAEIARLRTALAELATRMDDFRPGGEIGPLFGVGQSHAFHDAAAAIREILAGEKT